MAGKPIFGHWYRNRHASESNPIRDLRYVRSGFRHGRLNSGKYWEMIDDEGKVHQFPPDVFDLLPQPPDPRDAEIARLTAELSASRERERVLRELIQETIELDDAALAELNEMGISHLGHSHTNKLRDALRTGGSDGN